MNLNEFEARKREHIKEALNPAHQTRHLSGLDQIVLVHDAIPQLNLSEVSIQSIALGSSTPTPFFIAAMTAGHTDARAFNLQLAKACSKRGWALGLGSMRRDLTRSNNASDHSPSPDHWRELRDQFPQLTLYANIGLSQLKDIHPEALDQLIQELRPQALAIHCNPLQECLQPEGTPHFAQSLESITELAKKVPILLKETGSGFSTKALNKIARSPIKAIDVSGLGGTHWGRLEGSRAKAGSMHARAAQTFADWGVSLVDSILQTQKALPQVEVWATGGIRNGLDAAKTLALGASQVGFAQPALQALTEGTLENFMEQMEFELKIALFCTGSATLADLKNAIKVPTGER